MSGKNPQNVWPWTSSKSLTTQTIELFEYSWKSYLPWGRCLSGLRLHVFLLNYLSNFQYTYWFNHGQEAGLSHLQAFWFRSIQGCKPVFFTNKGNKLEVTTIFFFLQHNEPSTFFLPSVSLPLVSFPINFPRLLISPSWCQNSARDIIL